MKAFFSLAVVSDRLQAITRAMDLDPNQPARLNLYTGPVPLPGQPPDKAVLLASLAFPKPSLDRVAGHEIYVRSPVTSLAGATGKVEWARIENGAGQYVVDLDAGGPASDAAVKVKTKGTTSDTLYIGGEVSVDSVKFEEP